MRRSKFHKERASGIGGSDAPIILGVSRYMTPLQLWAQKTGFLEGDDDDDSELLRWGRLVEPLVLKQFSKEADRKVIRPKEMVRHPDIDWLIGHLDGLQVDKEMGQGVLEGKNVSRYVSERWLEEVPVEVQIQAQHYMAATGLPFATAVALVGGHKLVWQDIERHDRFIEAMLEEEEKFWHRVLADNPPTAKSADFKFMNYLIRPEEGKTIVLNEVAIDLTVELRSVLGEIEKQKAVMDPLVERKEEIEAQIKQLIGDAETASLPDGTQFTFKTTKRKGHTVKPSEFRQLRRKDP